MFTARRSIQFEAPGGSWGEHRAFAVAVMGAAAIAAVAYRSPSVAFAEEVQRLKRWEDRWSKDMTGWHVMGVNRQLEKFFETLWPPGELASLASQGKVPRMLIPLCGKTVDMAFLSRQGFAIVGIEGVKKAIDEFATEQGLTGRAVPVALPPALDRDRFKMHAVLIGAGDGEATRKQPPPPVLLLEGDFVSISSNEAAAIVPFPAAFDRGGLVAVEPTDRAAYARVLADLIQPGGRLLLVCVEHDPFADGRLGPPFEVTKSDVATLFNASFEIDMLHREDRLEEMKDRGCTRFHECVYLLKRRGSAQPS